MAEIDFNNYRKEITVENDLNLDLSGLNVRADGANINVNEDGEVEDINLNQIIDDKVNFIFERDVKRFEVSTDPSTGFGTEASEAIVHLRGEPVVDLVEQINYRDSADSSGTPKAATLFSAGIDENLEVVSYEIPIVPQHNKMKDDILGSTRGPLIDREVYAALGMWDTNDFTITDRGRYDIPSLTPAFKMGISDNDAAGYITRQFYTDSLKRLKDKLNSVGIDVLVTEFLESKPSGTNDINASGVTRADNFNTSITAGNAFIGRLLTEIDSENISPVHMSVKEVFKAQFDSANDLRNQLITSISNLITAIDSMPFAGRFFDEIKEILQKSFTSNPRPLIDPKTGNPVVHQGKFLIGQDGKHVLDPTGKSNLVDISFIPENTLTPELRHINLLEIDPSSTLDTNSDSPIDDMLSKLPENDDGVISIIKEQDLVITPGFDPIELVENIKKINTQFKGFSGVLSGIFTNFALSDIRTRTNEFELLIKKIEWYERFTSESIFENKDMLIDNNTKNDKRRLVEKNNPNIKLARILLPVDFGIKTIRTRRRGWFRRARYKRIDNGVRWVELRFIDTRVLSLFRPNEREAGVNLIENPIDSTITLSRVEPIAGHVLVVTEEPHMATEDTLQIEISGIDQAIYNGFFRPNIIDDNTLSYSLELSKEELANTPDPTGSATLNSVINPLDETQPDISREDVEIVFNMPHLPFDDDLRDEAYFNYGPFDQSEFSSREGELPITVSTNNDTTVQLSEIPAGHEIFHESSKEISDLRKGVDVYNKVQFLLEILKSEFNPSRVKLIETTRSWESQENLQTGGTSSSFLSWHNYGLSVKILITKEDGVTPIEEGDEEEFCKLVDVSTAFIEGAKLGKFGEPMNVIWCAQLVMGPDLFVWEFLPIGIKHMDAWKFRQAAFNQQDPVVANAYVNVDQRGYVIVDDVEIDDDKPYIRASSTAYQDAIVINGERYVSPQDINQFNTPSNLVLKDIQEFLFMVRQKMHAHGRRLIGTVPEWKAKNPISFQQLVDYYSLIGDFNAVRGILSSDYIEKFDYLISSVAETNPIDFVVKFLGEEEYQNIKIFIKDSGDTSYITLHDGKISIPVADVRSLNTEGNGNTFGEKQINEDSVQFGRYNSQGVFVPEEVQPLEIITSDAPVISGYNEAGEPIGEDALLLHIIVKDSIVEEYNEIKELIENLDIDFLYDNFLESPNADQINLIENEFGIIRTQTLIENDSGELLTPEEVKDMTQKMKINDQKVTNDGTVRGLGPNIEEVNQDIDFDPEQDRNENQSVFEKLVSNAQLQGIQKAKLTREKPVIEELQGDATVERTIKEIQNENTPDVRDIL